MNSFSDSDYWKGITLYGLNAVTYKMTLGIALLNKAQDGDSTIT